MELMRTEETISERYKKLMEQITDKKIELRN